MFFKIAHIRRDCNSAFVGLEVCSFSLLQTAFDQQGVGVSKIHQNSLKQIYAELWHGFDTVVSAAWFPYGM